MEQTSSTPEASAASAGTTGTAAGKFDKAKDFVNEKYTAASEAVKERYTGVRDKVSEIDYAGAADQIRAYVKSNPGKALLMSIGVGFVVGLLLRRSDDDEE